MSDTFAVLAYEEGVLSEASRHGTRERAEHAFTAAVETADGLSGETGAWYRVELWCGEVLLGLFDTADRP
ncbi:hypothetical protein [Salinarimonas soli]|uniref:Uncharacterized protein n=1 Tax=Salinarimonas soli TaxID=1638099 RepID=A0A5B2VS40_9HYPH|nr:hypothetical protein [Salinarimonas soli]KAA2241166.1 hypothetical protein F0L46_05040 [Salinarimonas soli]